MRRAVPVFALLLAVPSLARAQADFWMGNVAVGPPTAAVGTMISIGATLASNGTFIGNVDCRFYLSPDAVLDPADIPVFSSGVVLGGGPNVTVTGGFPLPNTVPVGTYHLIAEADYTNAITETNELNNWAASTSRIEVLGADLELVSWTVPNIAVIGSPYVLQPVIANSGLATATDFRYEYRLGTTVLHTSGLNTLAGSSSATFGDPITFSGPPGTIMLTIVIDSTSVVPEDSEANNIAFSAPITLIEALPDLSVDLVEVDPPARAGESLSVTSRLKNVGIESSGSFDYAYYLSEDPDITTGDRLLAMYSSNIPAQREAVANDIFVVPEEVPGGTYYLGLIADPANAIPELDETNNTAHSASFSISDIPIVFVTRALPIAIVGRSYSAEIIVVATPRATVELVSGALPDGLVFDATNTAISGTPSAAGDFSFRLRATNALAFIEQEFTIDVVEQSELEIVTTMLPDAIINARYDAQLEARGGNPPYRWSRMALQPEGLALGAEDGSISWRPDTTGAHAMEVFLTDETGMTVSRAFTIRVLPRGVVMIDNPALPKALLGYSYCDGFVKRLTARGGEPPYVWSAITPLPLGMTLSADGEVCGIPREVGLFAFEVRAEDQRGDRGAARVVLEVFEGGELDNAGSSGCSCSAAADSRYSGVVWCCFIILLLAVRRRAP